MISRLNGLNRLEGRARIHTTLLILTINRFISYTTVTVSVGFIVTHQLGAVHPGLCELLRRLGRAFSNGSGGSIWSTIMRVDEACYPEMGKVIKFMCWKPVAF